MIDSDLAGWLLLASFLLWLPAAVLPQRIWTAPLAERLRLVAEHRRRWQAVNLGIAAATVLLVLGFAALAEPLREAGAGVLVSLSLVTLVLGAGLWLASLVFRLTATASAGAEPPAGFAVVSAWAGGLFLAWSVLGNAAVVGFGAAIVRSGYPAAWCGWTAVALGALVLVQLAVTGDALPALYHVGPALVGVALLID
jgi:hypothetical protein